MKSKLLSHFIKGKFSLTHVKTIIVIPRELEYLEGLVKLVRRRKDVEVHKNQVDTIHPTHAICRINVNKTHHNKTLHLAIEIN
jgi:hypothetical protein